MEATKKLFPPDGFRITDYAVALLSLGLNPKFCITKLQTILYSCFAMQNHKHVFTSCQKELSKALFDFK